VRIVRAVATPVRFPPCQHPFGSELLVILDDVNVLARDTGEVVPSLFPWKASFFHTSPRLPPHCSSPFSRRYLISNLSSPLFPSLSFDHSNSGMVFLWTRVPLQHFSTTPKIYCRFFSLGWFHARQAHFSFGPRFVPWVLHRLSFFSQQRMAPFAFRLPFPRRTFFSPQFRTRRPS